MDVDGGKTNRSADSGKLYEKNEGQWQIKHRHLQQAVAYVKDNQMVSIQAGPVG